MRSRKVGGGLQAFQLIANRRQAARGANMKRVALSGGGWRGQKERRSLGLSAPQDGRHALKGSMAYVGFVVFPGVQLCDPGIRDASLIGQPP